MYTYRVIVIIYYYNSNRFARSHQPFSQPAKQEPAIIVIRKILKPQKVKALSCWCERAKFPTLWHTTVSKTASIFGETQNLGPNRSQLPCQQKKNKKASRETNAQTTKPTTRPLPRSEGKQRERGKQESAPEARRDKAKQNDTQSNPAGAKNL